MFCPKCAEANADEAKYCRACREDLRVVAQAMQGRSPVLLASKLDAFFERTQERLRRDGILNILFGALYLLRGLFDVPLPLIAYAFALGFFAYGIWNLLAFKYSRSQPPKPTPALSSGATLYCAQCGRPNGRGTRFCPDCGLDLQVLQQALTPRWPRFLTDRLDHFIEHHKKGVQGNVKKTISSLAFLLLGVVSLRMGDPWFATTMFVWGFTYLLVGWWDGLVERRIASSTPPNRSESSTPPHYFDFNFGEWIPWWLGGDSGGNLRVTPTPASYMPPPSPTPTARDLSEQTTPLQLSPPPSVTESTTRLLDETREPAAKE